MILCEPKVAKPRRDPYERSLAELRLFPDRNPSSMHSLNYSRLGICIDITVEIEFSPSIIASI